MFSDFGKMIQIGMCIYRLRQPKKARAILQIPTVLPEPFLLWKSNEMDKWIGVVLTVLYEMMSSYEYKLTRAAIEDLDHTACAGAQSDPRVFDGRSIDSQGSAFFQVEN